MKMKHTAPEKLKDALNASRLFGDWLGGSLGDQLPGPGGLSASGELARALEYEPFGEEPAPLFAQGFANSMVGAQEADLPCESDRELFHDNLSALRAGKASVVVTGQQPGFLGGPLYTLYKIATTVALARARTESGRPTVPVFWSGDDDDDLVEALSPVYWDPDPGIIRQAMGPGSRLGGRPVMIGTMAGQGWMESAAHWLRRVAESGDRRSPQLATDLADIWAEVLRDKLPVDILARRALLRVFTGTGLMIVSGNDPGLHSSAAPFYDKVREQGDNLAELAARRGHQLTESGYHAQIQQRSLARPLFRVLDERRHPLEPGEPQANVATLRPGVMLRSPLQDWLLCPAAVVVGPGELAYLRQLDPLYEALGVERSPLVPRLFAWLVPRKFDPSLVAAFRSGEPSNPQLAEELADGAEVEARALLAAVLTDRVGVSAERAESLAAGRAHRWRKGVAAMLRDEIERVRKASLPRRPAWVFPEGQRQERHLAYGCAAALWGDELVAGCLAAASAHLEFGRNNDWREFLLEVSDP